MDFSRPDLLLFFFKLMLHVFGKSCLLHATELCQELCQLFQIFGIFNEEKNIFNRFGFQENQ